MMTRNKTLEPQQGDLFTVFLRDIVDLNHPLVRLAGQVDWNQFEEALAGLRRRRRAAFRAHPPSTRLSAGGAGRAVARSAGCHCLGRFTGELVQCRVSAGPAGPLFA